MSDFGDTVDMEIRDGVAMIGIDNPPVNVLSHNVREALSQAVASADVDPSVQAIVIFCHGRTFIAGADIREFDRPPTGTSLYELHDVIENTSKPLIAAMHGTTLGGGLETALCGHFRVAVESAQFGLPEVHLGLLPGAGGTQRLPRVIGVPKALEMMVSGKPIGAAEALELGLLDELVSEPMQGGFEFAQRVVADSRPLVQVRDLGQKLNDAKQDPDLFVRFRQSIARKTRGFAAPEAIVQCVEDALSKPFDDAIAAERKRFAELLHGEKSAAQRHYFFAERKASKLSDVPRDTAQLPIELVGIVGAGTMGGGISMNFLNIGLPVTIVESSQAALDRGLAVIRKNYDRSVKSGRLTQADVEQRMARLTPTLTLSDLAECDLIIEAVYEDFKLKKEIFQQLDQVAKEGAILATNTSALDVNEIAAVTNRPESVLGTHFFSPANVMKLCEVVRAEKTSKEVLATVMSLAKRIGKVAVVSGVCHGFIGNRILFAREAQCQQMILEGPMPWDVDRVLYEFGLPMGPFAMNDLAGLDIGWAAQSSRGETIRDRLCELDRRGQKTGAGFDVYDPETRKPSPDPVVEKLILEFSDRQGIKRRDFSDEEILDRALLPMFNEAAKILEEGHSARPSDIDVVWVNGYGWPVYRGGPLFYADSLGLPLVWSKLRDLQQCRGDFWKPASLLEQLVADGKSFGDLN